MPPQRQDAPPQHQGPLPSPHIRSNRVNTPEHFDSPTGVRSPEPPSQPNNPPPSSSAVPYKPVALPARPWPPAPLALGVDPKAPKTANKVYDSVVASMLTKSQHQFECLLFVKDAYPGIDTQIQWSIECWETVCSETRCCYALSKEMMSLVRDTHTLSTPIARC